MTNGTSTVSLQKWQMPTCVHVVDSKNLANQGHAQLFGVDSNLVNLSIDNRKTRIY